MGKATDRRLARLEALPSFGGGWRGWVGKPMELWPDAALEAYLRAMVVPGEVPEGLRGDLATGELLSDELLRHVAAGRERRA